MRRKDREMDRDFALDLVDRSEFGNLAMVDNGHPYVLPISFVRDGRFLYFHSANSGRKIDILNKKPWVSISFVGKVEVPNLYQEEDLEKIRSRGEIQKVVSRIFTTEYESAIVEGQIDRLKTRKEKVEALASICKKYTPNRLEFFSDAVADELDYVNVYSVEIEDISGKRKKYDKDGREMKWGRMD